MKYSDMMRQFRSFDTKPEKLIRHLLWDNGFRFRKGYRIKGIRVDIAFPRQKLAIFIDGCFWHGCPLHYRRPKTHKKYWDLKLHKNLARDSRNNDLLKETGWLVIRIWEHEPLKAAFEKIKSVLSTYNHT